MVGETEVNLDQDKLVQAECVRQRNEVAIELGIISPLSSRRLLKTIEGGIVGF